MGYIYQMWLLYQSAFLFLDGDDITWSSYVLVISLIDFLIYIFLSLSQCLVASLLGTILVWLGLIMERDP
jgi:hypothetical protein